jgi:hypothetical protein
LSDLSIYKTQKTLSLSDKNVKAALPTTSDSHAPPKADAAGLAEREPSCPNQAANRHKRYTKPLQFIALIHKLNHKPRI